MKTIKLKSIFALILFSFLTFGLASIATAQNDFSGDGNAVALWSVDNGALTTDSIGTNTLADNNTVGTDTVNYQEGDASADFESSNSQFLSIADADLNSGFPLKSGRSNDDFSVTFWYKAESKGNYRPLVSKFDYGSGARSFIIRDHQGTLQFYIGHTSGTAGELLDSSLSLSTGVWYHIAATFNNTTKDWTLIVWDDFSNGGEIALNASGTAANNISITDAPFAIGAWFNNGTDLHHLDGLIDEVVVFRDILTTGEIDQIRQGTYAEVSPPTTTTTLAPTTTTTTLAPTTTTTTLAPATTTTTLAPTTTTTTFPGATTTTTTLLGGTTTTTLFPPTSAGTNISNNGFEDSFPKTAGGYVVWQGKAGNDLEIFLYNANNGFGPVQITDNDYGDINPETDGRYVTWASGFAPYGEIFLYDIETPTTIRITDYQYTDQLNTSCKASADPYPCCTDGGICVVDETPVNCDGSCDSYTECVDTYGGPGVKLEWTGTGTCNSQYDHDPKIVDGVVVWVSHSEGVDTIYGPGDIMLYNAAYGSYENISKQIDPNNEHDDYAFRFDGNRIQWVQNTSGDMPNYVYNPIDDKWVPESNSNIRNYVYDLKTKKYYRYYIPDDEDLNPDTEYYVFGAEYYVEDLTAGTGYIQTESPAVLVDQQSDGDFSVNAMWINGDREILLMDRQNKHGGFLTDNDINDIQPAIKDNIVVWTGGRGDDAEIYTYVIPNLALVSPDNGIEFTLKEFPVFVWEGGGYIQFKIQFSTVASFEGQQYTRTFPKSDDAWLNEPFVTLDKKQVNAIKGLLGDNNNSQLLYWRVLAQDSSGNEEISQARHMVLSK